jgi:hypothetical protein
VAESYVQFFFECVIVLECAPSHTSSAGEAIPVLLYSKVSGVKLDAGSRDFRGSATQPGLNLFRRSLPAPAGKKHAQAVARGSRDTVAGPSCWIAHSVEPRASWQPLALPTASSTSSQNGVENARYGAFEAIFLVDLSRAEGRSGAHLCWTPCLRPEGWHGSGEPA